MEIMGFNLTDNEYSKFNSLAQKVYNWNSLNLNERQSILKDKILK